MRASLTNFDLITSPEQFEKQALRLFTFQYENNPVYRSYCDLINCAISEVRTLRDIPFLPIQFFKTKKVYCQNTPIDCVFESSKTTGQIASKHYIADLALYEKSFLKSFELFYGDIEEYAFLALLPSYLERGNSSLVYMAERLIQKSKHPLSGFYLNEWDALIKTLNTLEGKQQKTILLGVTFALLNGAENYKWDLKNTFVMETGGMKGMRKEWVRKALHEKLQCGFGVKKIHAEYGMTELLSQAYSKSEGRFYPPPWMRIHTRSTDDPFELLNHNINGAINIIDLANVDSCAFIATQDLGKTFPDGSFEILGRFDQAEIRGCNLMVV
jgi:phenylacetate-coenzyme A ligase PaaK-like adenylate-forming protein